MFVVVVVLLLWFFSVFSYWLNLVLGSVDSNRSVCVAAHVKHDPELNTGHKSILHGGTQIMPRGNKTRKLDSCKK